MSVMQGTDALTLIQTYFMTLRPQHTFLPLRSCHKFLQYNTSVIKNLKISKQIIQNPRNVKRRSFDRIRSPKMLRQTSDMQSCVL